MEKEPNRTELVHAVSCFFDLGRHIQNSAITMAALEVFEQTEKKGKWNPFAVIVRGDHSIVRERCERLGRAITNIHEIENQKRLAIGLSPLQATPVDGESVHLFLSSAAHYFDELCTIQQGQCVDILHIYKETHDEAAVFTYTKEHIKEDLQPPPFEQE